MIQLERAVLRVARHAEFESATFGFGGDPLEVTGVALRGNKPTLADAEALAASARSTVVHTDSAPALADPAARPLRPDQLLGAIAAM